MICPDGTEIPDPPEDPEERKEWKKTYYFMLYRMSDEKLKEFLSRMIKD